VTTADTEILAARAAVERLPDGFPELRCANPAAGLPDGFLDGARVVLCRILGGRRGWADGLDALRADCTARGIALLALGGEAEPDAEMTALSTAPPGAVAQAGEYLRHGDVENVEQLLRFLADTFLLEGYGFEPPHEVADLGVYGEPRIDPDRPTVGVCFYRSHFLTRNTAFVDALCAAIEEAGANALPVWSYTLRRDVDGRVPAFDLLDGRVDALITTMLATGGSGAADEWDAEALAALDVPVIQAVCATSQEVPVGRQTTFAARAGPEAHVLAGPGAEPPAPDRAPARRAGGVEVAPRDGQRPRAGDREVRRDGIRSVEVRPADPAARTGPVHVVRVERHPGRRALRADEPGVGVGPVEVRAPDRVGAGTGPVDVAVVDRKRARPDRIPDEVLDGARAVEVRAPDRAGGGVGPVDIRARRRRPRAAHRRRDRHHP
jgi:CobN/Magnesium Chelatase